jgi:hypothetical protein
MPRRDAHKGKHGAAVERRLQAFELYKIGVPYREIGHQLGVSGKTAHEDVQSVLADLVAQSLDSAAAWRALELERLDSYAFSLHQHQDTGDPQIINSLVKISESRRKLLGLDLQTGTLLPSNVEIIVKWHDDRRDIIDITPAADNHAAAAPQLTEPGSAAPGALPYRVRWSEMGQVEASGDAEPENGA